MRIQTGLTLPTIPEASGRERLGNTDAPGHKGDKGNKEADILDKNLPVDSQKSYQRGTSEKVD